MMSAITFAEAGEFETAKEMEKNGNVLLVLRGVESERKSLKYALNISKRIGAGLEVLFVSAQKGVGEVLGAIEKAIEEKAKNEGVALRVERKNGCIKKEIVSYTRKRRDIKFVVVESAETLDIDCGDKKLADGWEKLSCPLVVVSEQA